MIVFRKEIRICALIALFLTITCAMNAQTASQRLRGTVKSAINHEPVAYATIMLTDNTRFTAISDSLGHFHIDNVPVGRHNLRCQYVGYETVEMNELLVTSAKETYVEILLNENVQELRDVVVRPKVTKEKALNRMVLTGGRMFSVEETSRYAGGFDDPARLATAFAGVASGGATNGISIHGNAPHLLAWHLEDMEIPNPNHFSDISVLGGGIFSSLSAMCIGNSDFLTSAFPAEYGNAVSGVFDMKMRKGNDQKYEHAVQLGVGGIDIASEGPINRNTGASYLFNYRYSMTGLANQIGMIDMQGQVMDYQDLNFKLYLPTAKSGVFSVWGTGYIDRFHNGEKPSEWNSKQDESYAESDQYMGAMGINHSLSMPHGMLKTNIGVTFSNDDLLTDTYDLPEDFDFNRENTEGLTRSPYFTGIRKYMNISARSTYSHRFSSKWNAQFGASYTTMLFDVKLREAYKAQGELHTICDNDGTTGLLTAFTTHSLNLGNRTTLNLGVNLQHLALNSATILEPRLGISFKTSPKTTLAFAYGMHSRAEKLDIYFTRRLSDPNVTGNWDITPVESDELVNKDLGFTRSHHAMMTFGYKINDNWNLKIEPYAQLLFDVPVEPGKPYSVLNRQEFYLDKQLVNKGKGRNIGVDLTLERYLNNGWYGMFSGSFFSSKYKGGDGVWRHTAFDRGYIVNMLGGKEWMLGRHGNNMLSMNVKATFQGGDRYSPIDREATLAHPDYEVQYDESKSYSLQRSPMFILHYTVSYRINRRGLTHEFSIKHVNCTGTKSFYGYEYAYREDTFKPMTFNFSLPNVSYKLEF